ncbi:MAG TPA: hypothetical protein VHE53_02510 [Patescibacteria group bacterium]|nr:hypothetical protein [Patescibacteria group bacterium]
MPKNNLRLTKKKLILALNCFLLVFSIILATFIIGKPNKENHDGNNNTNYTKLFVTKCKNTQTWRTCYGEKLSSFVKTNTIDSTLLLLNDIENQDPKTRDCHILAHYISSAVVEKNPKDWRKLLQKVNIAACNYGFVHGSIEGLSRYDKSFEINPKNIPGICEQINNISKANSDQGCAHIMGHILLSEQCDQSVEEGLKTTISECDELPINLQHECYAGAFMESFTRDNLNSECNTPHIPWGTEAIAMQQENTCLQYSGKQADSCWQEISHIYNALFPNNPERVYGECQHAPTKENTIYCYHHAVFTLVLNESADKKYFASLCEPFLNYEPNYTTCYKDIVMSLISASSKFETKAKQFCNSLDHRYTNFCLATLDNTIK